MFLHRVTIQTLTVCRDCCLVWLEQRSKFLQITSSDDAIQIPKQTAGRMSQQRSIGKSKFTFLILIAALYQQFCNLILQMHGNDSTFEHSVKIQCRSTFAYIFSKMPYAGNCWQRSSLKSVANIRDLCCPENNGLSCLVSDEKNNTILRESVDQLHLSAGKQRSCSI